MTFENNNAGGSDNQQGTDKTTEGAGAGAGGENNTPSEQNGSGGGGTGEGGSADDKSKETLVPSYRLKEEADKRREAEAKLKEYQDKEVQEGEKKMKEQGKYKELLTEKEAKIAELETTVATISSYESIVSTQVEAQIEDIKKDIGEESLKSILDMVGYENANVLDKYNLISKVKEIASKMKPSATGGTGAGAGATDSQKIEEAKKGGFDSFLGALLQK